MPATFSSSDFNRDSGAAKRAAAQGPVIITDRGEPSHVLMRYEDYRRLAGVKQRSLAQALALPGVEAIEFDPPALPGRPQAAEFD